MTVKEAQKKIREAKAQESIADAMLSIDRRLARIEKELGIGAKPGKPKPADKVEDKVAEEDEATNPESTDNGPAVSEQ